MSENPPHDKIEQIIKLFNTEKLSKVIKNCNELIKEYPKSIFLWNILGVTYAKLQNFKEAIKCFKNTIQIEPKLTEAYYNLGKTLKELGRIEEAISNYKIAIELKPSYAEAHNNLGNALKEFGKLEDAVLSYKNSIIIKPNLVEAHYNLGNTLKALGKPREAIENYKNAINHKPNYAECYNELGGAQIDLGELSNGILSYKHAIKIKPDYAECYNNYVNSLKIKNNDPILSKLEKTIYKKDLSLKENIYLSFAIGKAKLDIGKIEEGIKFINIGNKLKKKELNYDIKKTKNTFNKIKKIFKDIKFKNIKNDILHTNQPIFIVGMPRSGTTLVEQILSSHSDIYGAGELDFLYDSINSIDWENRKIEIDDFKKIKKNYIFKLNKICNSKYVTDKMPLNFQWIGFIFHAFPNSKIINIKRNPMATCWSNYKTNFSKNGMAFTFNQVDIAEYFNLYENLMEFWKEKFPKKIYDLNYEELTEKQEEETKKVFNYLNINWENSVLDFYKNNRIVQTASNIQVRQKMYRGSSKEWKKYAKWLEPMIKTLNK